MKLTRIQQFGVGVAIVLIVIVLGELVFFKDTHARIEKLNKDIQELDLQIAEAKAIQKYAATLEEEMNHLKAQLERLKKILPVEVNKPKFLQDIRRYANEHGLEVETFSANNPVRDDVILEHPFTIFVRGNYHDLGNFFAKLSNYPRIINVKGLHVSKNKENPAYSLDSAFLLSIFTYQEPTEEELKKQVEAKKMERQGIDPNAKKKRKR
ncbi:MAG: type 4a pilus biogenesis protein PilO [Acidobacteria bacterium]|nr:type 4a pilus biogenesis protein PilO [Acidobacteriota bacterium]